jgi:hypothetical protein
MYHALAHDNNPNVVVSSFAIVTLWEIVGR